MPKYRINVSPYLALLDRMRPLVESDEEESGVVGALAEEEAKARAKAAERWQKAVAEQRQQAVARLKGHRAGTWERAVSAASAHDSQDR